MESSLITTITTNTNTPSATASATFTTAAATAVTAIASTGSITTTSAGASAAIPVTVIGSSGSPAVAAAAASSSTSGSSSIITQQTSVLVSCGSLPIASTSSAGMQQLPPIDIIKQQYPSEDVNLSLASGGLSEGQRSLSGAPSASSSPILSPSGKIFGRNANGTMVATSRPSNEAEIQLYRVLQRASLLSYYDTLLEMGGDDVQQLYEAGEEEFLEIMALVGMASKPLHVRRLQKALHEWASNPSLFQGSLAAAPTTPGLCDTPTKPTVIFNPEPTPSPSHSRIKLPTYNPIPVFNPTPLISTAPTGSTNLFSPMSMPAINVPVIQPHTSSSSFSIPVTHAATSAVAAAAAAAAGVPTALSLTSVLPPATHPTSGSTSHQVTSSSPQLTPLLTELQVSRITLGAEKIARQLPQREPRAQTSKKRTSRELEQVIAMSENDPRRMDEIRKFSAIYGRFDCKRRPEKPLTLHEVCVNEAAAQLCRLVPALLTRRDELFPLARQIVKDAGFGHSASIARYGGLLPQVQPAQTSSQRSTVVVDCESSESSTVSNNVKRQRLSSTETTTPTSADLNRDSSEDSRYNLFAMYQKFAKPSFDLSDIAKFTMSKSDIDDNDNENENDNDNDNDSRYSFSNSSSSPSLPHNGVESERDRDRDRERERDRERDLTDRINLITDEAHSTCSTSAAGGQPPTQFIVSSKERIRSASESAAAPINTNPSMLGGGVQIISAAGGHIIAVANPALALSPTLNDAFSMKRENTNNTPPM